MLNETIEERDTRRAFEAALEGPARRAVQDRLLNEYYRIKAPDLEAAPKFTEEERAMIEELKAEMLNGYGGTRHKIVLSAFEHIAEQLQLAQRKADIPQQSARGLAWYLARQFRNSWNEDGKELMTYYGQLSKEDFEPPKVKSKDWQTLREFIGESAQRQLSRAVLVPTPKGFRELQWLLDRWTTGFLIAQKSARVTQLSFEIHVSQFVYDKVFECGKLLATP